MSNFRPIPTTCWVGYSTGKDPAKAPTGGTPLRFFSTNEVFYYDQAVALVVADSFEEVLHAAKLVKVQYEKEAHQTNLKLTITSVMQRLRQE